MYIKKSILIVFFTLIFSCSRNDIIILLTDNKIVPFYVNQFNIENKTSFIVKYKDYINMEAINKENARIVISKTIDNINIIKNFKNIKKYYSPDYTILKNISDKFTYRIIPLSFDVPILIYKKEYNIGQYMDLQSIKSAYKIFQREKKFFISPYISESLFYTISTINKTNFYSANNNQEHDEKKMLNIINYFKSFLDANELKLQKKFTEKYKYLKLENILLEKNTLLIAGLSNLTYYNRLNKDIKNKLNFLYLTDQNKKLTVSNISFMGVQELSQPIEKFIKWILDKETQKTLIQLKDKTKFNEHFGFISGLTSYKSLNLQFSSIIKEATSFIIDENYINQNSYILNKKQIEKEIQAINESFLSSIMKNPN
ncbi:hypothetical protein F0310_01715 [Borrelia sp. A-FGy1]|uniref:hypothetical protein n=1 Tax=Borrelia sp. A-FGy1 TaxID=2608247 RepID=UPI0015F706FA|nr:hypothetical protein [Borrelia sp. A-FGy1]QMU99141.1 hypothetical protein F0310_01715 [Borrelia sp. A-FGy1]